MTEPTPGPWHISTSGQYIRKNDGPNWPAWNICELNLDHERADANANLIASAPDILAALEQAAMDMEAFRLAMNAQDRAFFAPCVERARAAIKKARGQS
jgi:hypothetical protein